MAKVEDLNAAVTLAIFKAEHASLEAAKLWRDVAACEAALYEVLPKGSLESDIAKRGVVTANAEADQDPFIHVLAERLSQLTGLTGKAWPAELYDEALMIIRMIKSRTKNVPGTRYPVAQLLAELAEGSSLTELAADVNIPEESFKQALRELALRS